MFDVVFSARNGATKGWLDVCEPTEEELEQLEREYAIPRSALDACMAPQHLPRFERIEDTATFIIARTYDERSLPQANSYLDMTRKLSFFLSERFLVTVHRRPLPYLDEVKDRARRAKKPGTLRQWMLEVLLAGIDTFAEPLEEAEQRVHEFEAKLLAEAASADIAWQDVFRTKVRIQTVKRLLWHTQNAMQRYAAAGVENRSGPESRTAAEARVTAEIRERIASLSFFAESLDNDIDNLLDVQLSLSAERTNDVVRVLTLFSAFFLPITFIAGVYGMNFHHMPELASEYGYPLVWLVIGGTVAVIYAWFRSRGWMR